MSPWWILAVMLLLAGVGWHFLGRFLGRWFFPATTLLPRAIAAPGGRAAVVCTVNQTVLLLGGGLLVSIPLASFWGWGPVALWLLVGGLGVCGMTAAGLHFLDGRYPLDGFAAVSKDLLGRHGSRSMVLLLQIAATLIHVLLLVVASQLMALFPVAASLVLLHWVPFLVLKKTRLWRSGTGSIIVLVVVWLLLLPIASILPLRLVGEIYLLGSGDTQFVVQPSTLWLFMLVMLYGLMLRQGHEAVVRYRLAVGVLCMLLLLSAMFGMLTISAIMVIPRITTVAPAPILPGLLISLPAVTFGAWYMISVVGSTRTQQRMTPLHSYVGITVAVLAGLIWLVMIGVGDAQSTSLSWQSQQSLQYAFSGALARVADLVSQLGISSASSLGFAGFTAIVLLMAALQAGLRGQRILLNDAIKNMANHSFRLSSLLLTAFTAGLALFILPDHGLTALWVAWGVASALVSAGLLVMIGLALSRQQRAGGLALSMGLLVWGVGQWAGLQGLLQHTGYWQPHEVLYAVLLLLGSWLMLACLQCWRKLRIAANKTPGKINLLLR